MPREITVLYRLCTFGQPGQLNIFCVHYLGLGIGIEADAAGNDFPASVISVRYRSISVPDWVLLSRYRAGSGISIFVHSGTGMPGCHIARHSGINEMSVKCYYGVSNFTDRQLPQSGIGIPASVSVRYLWSRISPENAQQ